MELAIKFHGCIDRFNILKAPTDRLSSCFGNHPTAYKISLIFDHLFRAAVMVGFMLIPGIPKYISMPICFAGSLFYRLTVEKKCAYKFALPSFAGAAAFILALPAFINMINGTAFVTAGAGVIACTSFLPLALYGAYILLTVSYDVDRELGKLPVGEQNIANSQDSSIQPEPDQGCHCQSFEKV